MSKVFERIVFDQLYDYLRQMGCYSIVRMVSENTPFDWVSCFRTNGQNSSGNRLEEDSILCLLRFVKGILHPQSCYFIEKTPILWLVGHHFILVQKLPFWPYPVHWIQRNSFGKETYRNRCATRFNIGFFIICYIYEWHTDCEWTSQLYFIRWWYDID